MSERTEWAKEEWLLSHIGEGRCSITTPSGRSVAEVWSLERGFPRPEMIAHARLIEAAPKAFAAIEAAYIAMHQNRAHTFRGDNQKVFIALREVLAQALDKDAQEVKAIYEHRAYWGTFKGGDT